MWRGNRILCIKSLFKNPINDFTYSIMECLNISHIAWGLICWDCKTKSTKLPRSTWCNKDILQKYDFALNWHSICLGAQTWRTSTISTWPEKHLLYSLRELINKYQAIKWKYGLFLSKYIFKLAQTTRAYSLVNILPSRLTEEKTSLSDVKCWQISLLHILNIVKTNNCYLRWYSPMNKTCIVMEKVQGFCYLEQTMLHLQQTHFLASKNPFEQAMIPQDQLIVHDR